MVAICSPTLPAIEAVLMILPPPPCAIICFAASCMPISTPRDAHDPRPIPFGRFQELAGLADAGIVEHDVEPAEGAHRRLDHGLHARTVNHIHLQCDRLA